MTHAPGAHDAAGGTCGREPLVDAITMFLAHDRAPHLADIRASLEHVMDEAGSDAVASLGIRLANAGADWAYYPRDPLARRIHHVLANRVLDELPVLHGAEHLARVAQKPVVLFANHLSYADANAVEFVVQQAGFSALSDRLTVVAGPKVYSNIRRRFSSLCFNSIKTPQSTARASEDAVLTSRELAHAARSSIRIARERLALGEALLVFGEGTRSRSGEMQPMLPGVARYLHGFDGWVLPIGIAGTEQLFPVGQDRLTPVRIVVRVGPPVRAADLVERADGDRRAIMDSIGFAIAGLLPPGYRGVYGAARD
jgi:1-acyl-sn-glycerol-3-phosphate acyltransferase